MKLVLLLILGFGLAGCVTTGPVQRRADLQSKTVTYAYQTAGETCYVRYLYQVAVDRICVEGDRIKYTASPGQAGQFLPMPGHVDALFNSISVEQVLKRRASVLPQYPVKRAVD